MGSCPNRVSCRKPILVALMVCLVVLSVAGPIGAPPANAAPQGVRLTLGPYLQNVTTNLATVCWGTDGAASGAIVYGTTSEYGALARAEPVEKVQCARLAGLAPYTRYHYKVLADGVALSSDASFKTLAGPEQQEISFVAWGDNRTNQAIHRRLAGRVKEVAPDLVINVGDFVESGRRIGDWNLFFDAERDILANAPFYPALGNHEENSPLYFSLLSLPGNERWYSFDSGPVHFIALDVAFSDYQPGSEQYAWLERDLRETSRPWKIAYFHHPPFTAGPSHEASFDVLAHVVKQFNNAGVQAVFSGHEHNFQFTGRNGNTGRTLYVVSGGGGQLRAGNIYSTMSKFGIAGWSPQRHFLLVEMERETLKVTPLSSEPVVVRDMHGRPIPMPLVVNRLN